jgi:hypothetical protein
MEFQSITRSGCEETSFSYKKISVPENIIRLTIYRLYPITGLDKPLGFQEVEAPKFLENRHMKVVKFLALRTGRLYPPGNIPGVHFC